MLIAVHQPNFMPNFPYFVKMGIADKFVIQRCVKFSKSNYQNFQNILGNRWCPPTVSGEIDIKDKRYCTGFKLEDVNMRYIRAIAGILGIKLSGRLVYDFPSEKTKTERLIELIKHYGGDAYIANSTAPEKYLDVPLLENNGIEFVPLKCDEQRNIIELFHYIGIQKTIELFNRTVEKNRKEIGCKLQLS